MENRKAVLPVLLALALMGYLAATIQAEEISRMTKDQLREVLGKPDVVVIDVRSNPDWIGSQQNIKTAVREDPKKVASWMAKYPKDKDLVFYCA
jgi:rhodanese-related sulfurtransferase